MRIQRQAWLLARNDLRQELRDFELVLTAGFFTLVMLALFGLSFGALRPDAHRVAVPGLLWLSVAFVGALTLTRLFDRERESDTLRMLFVAPVERLAIYLAKALVALVVLLGCCLLVVAGLVVMFPAASAFTESPGTTAALVFLGCVGYVAVGTLFAAGLATSGGKNVLLAVILYPVTTPFLLFALVATRALLEQHPSTTTYLGQLAALDVIFVVIAAVLFEGVVVGSGRGGPARRE